MQMSLPSLAGAASRGFAFLAVFALLVPLASGAVAQTPTALLLLEGASDCFGAGRRAWCPFSFRAGES